jgi:PAS domain S-box-containing protein
MPTSERELRLSFLGLTDADATRLRALRPLFARHAGEWIETFYGRLTQFPATAQLLQDRTTRERLQALLRSYLLRITEGEFDDAYFADRQRLGQTHERTGLLPRWYLLAYPCLGEIITPFVTQHFAADPALAQQSLATLHKVFLLDASLALDAHVASDRYRHLQFLESIIRDSGDCIFLLDAEKRFRAWNPAAEQLLGWNAAEVIGKPVTLICPPERLANGEMQRLDGEIDQTGHAQLETERLTRDGRRVPVDLSVSLLRGPQGEPIGRCAILRNITERKRLEDEKLRAERLAVIGAMSAKLAHEIRNPLSSIRLNLDLVGDEVRALATACPDPAREVQTLVAAVDHEVHRIQRVTEDYLQFARMPKPRREIVALNELLAHRLSFVQTLLDAAHVRLVTEWHPDLPYIAGDEEQLWQAILNLVRNAIEAMPGGGTLSVRTDRADNHVRLRVTDTGKGFTATERAELFKPFFSTKPGGTGLGLPLTQQIVVEHGGRIECETTPGHGTTFTIELPLTETLNHVPTH